MDRRGRGNQGAHGGARRPGCAPFPPRVRRRATIPKIALLLAAGWIALLAATAALAEVAGSLEWARSAIESADRSALVALWYGRDERTVSVAEGLTMLGKPAGTVPLTVFAVLAFAASGRPRDAATVLLSVVGSGALYLAIVGLVERPRPEMFGVRTGFSFPSGHAVATLGLAIPVAVGLVRARGRDFLAIAAGFLAIAIALAVGATRPYLQHHWPSDVGVSWLIATVWAAWVDRALARADARSYCASAPGTLQTRP